MPRTGAICATTSRSRIRMHGWSAIHGATTRRPSLPKINSHRVLLQLAPGELNADVGAIGAAAALTAALPCIAAPTPAVSRRIKVHTGLGARVLKKIALDGPAMPLALISSLTSGAAWGPLRRKAPGREAEPAVRKHGGGTRWTATRSAGASCP